VLRLPVVLRLLLENIIRNSPDDERQAGIDAIFGWLEHGTSEAELAYQPGRVLMHDTTSTPALVDIAAMRNALDEAGWDPSVLNPGLPVDISVDHSLAVEFFGQRDALDLNLQMEMRRNSERYAFLRWASKVMKGVRIHPPGTGIMHTINLEQLATVVTVEERDGETWVVPDTMIGTDSHTPMINGIGVLGWGVGGLEAQTVMFGMPTMLRVPDVIGVRLTGRLQAGAVATDLALTVTQRLRQIGVSGEFVEFFGPGVATLSAGERSVVANMAPEYGASTGFFPIDQHTLDYLRARPNAPPDASRWWRPMRAATPSGSTRMRSRPTPAASRSTSARSASTWPARNGRKTCWPIRTPPPRWARSVSSRPHRTRAMPRHPVVIAAITSCTNTSDPALLVAAGLVARRARAFGLTVPAWVKTSLGPGSPAAAAISSAPGCWTTCPASASTSSAMAARPASATPAP
jgi:aconitate hydratase